MQQRPRQTFSLPINLNMACLTRGGQRNPDFVMKPREKVCLATSKGTISINILYLQLKPGAHFWLNWDSQWTSNKQSLASLNLGGRLRMKCERAQRVSEMFVRKLGSISSRATLAWLLTFPPCQSFLSCSLIIDSLEAPIRRRRRRRQPLQRVNHGLDEQADFHSPSDPFEAVPNWHPGKLARKGDHFIALALIFSVSSI